MSDIKLQIKRWPNLKPLEKPVDEKTNFKKLAEQTIKESKPIIIDYN